MTSPGSGSPQNQVFESPLAQATRRRDLFQVQALLRDRADPNERNVVGETPLLQAAASGDLNVVALLVGHSADPAGALPDGRTENDAGWSPEVRSLFRIFEDRRVDTETSRRLLNSLDPGAHAQVRNKLHLGQKALPALPNRLRPAECLTGAPVHEVDTTADHRVTIHVADPTRPVLVLQPMWERATATVVLFHGLLQSGRMFERIARDLSKGLAHVQFIAPTAPTRSSLFGLGPAWFTHGGNHEQEFQEAYHETQEILGLERFALPYSHRVVYCGFSQGGTLATGIALRSPRDRAGLAIFGNGDAVALLDHESDGFSFSGLDVLQCHGKQDRMVKSEDARAGAANLRQCGCDARFELFPDVGHTINADMSAETRDWLRNCLPRDLEENNPKGVHDVVSRRLHPSKDKVAESSGRGPLENGEVSWMASALRTATGSMPEDSNTNVIPSSTDGDVVPAVSSWMASAFRETAGAEPNDEVDTVVAASVDVQAPATSSWMADALSQSVQVAERATRNDKSTAAKAKTRSRGSGMFSALAASAGKNVTETSLKGRITQAEHSLTADSSMNRARLPSSVAHEVDLKEETTSSSSRVRVGKNDDAKISRASGGAGRRWMAQAKGLQDLKSQSELNTSGNARHNATASTVDTCESSSTELPRLAEAVRQAACSTQTSGPPKLEAYPFEAEAVIQEADGSGSADLEPEKVEEIEMEPAPPSFDQSTQGKNCSRSNATVGGTVIEPGDATRDPAAVDGRIDQDQDCTVSGNDVEPDTITVDPEKVDATTTQDKDCMDCTVDPAEVDATDRQDKGATALGTLGGTAVEAEVHVGAPQEQDGSLGPPPQEQDGSPGPHEPEVDATARQDKGATALGTLGGTAVEPEVHLGAPQEQDVSPVGTAAEPGVTVKDAAVVDATTPQKVDAAEPEQVDPRSHVSEDHASNRQGPDARDHKSFEANPSKAEYSLSCAAKAGDLATVKSLLRQRADPNSFERVARPDQEEYPLVAAAIGGHAAVAAMLLLGKSDPCVRAVDGSSVSACARLKDPALSLLLSLAAGEAVTNAKDQLRAFRSVDEVTRFLIARVLAARGVRLAVPDVLDDDAWDRAVLVN